MLRAAQKSGPRARRALWLKALDTDALGRMLAKPLPVVVVVSVGPLIFQAVESS